MVFKIRFLTLFLLTCVCVLSKNAAAQMTWDDADRFYTQRCTQDFDTAFKTSATCQIDHQSFEKDGYNPNDLAAGHNTTPWKGDPNELCGQAALYSIIAPVPNTPACKDIPACVADMQQKVKKVVCRLGTDDKIVLEGDTLVTYVNQKAGDSVDYWTNHDLSKIFPEVKSQ